MIASAMRGGQTRLLNLVHAAEDMSSAVLGLHWHGNQHSSSNVMIAESWAVDCVSR